MEDINKYRVQGYISVRVAFLIPALLLLLVPLTNLITIQHAVNELSEQQDEQADNLLSTVKNILAADLSVLGNFEAYSELKTPLFVPRAEGEIDLDGRLNEWQDITPHAFGSDHLIVENSPYSASSLSLELRAQLSDTHLYLFFDVKDDAVIYRQISNISIHRNDHVRLAAVDQNGTFQRYTIATQQPGTVYGRVVSTGGRSLRREQRIEGVWRATDLGYELELKIDRTLLNDQLAFNVADVDSSIEREILTMIGSGATDQANELSTLIGPSPRLNALFTSMELKQIAFVDRFENLLAGSLQPGDQAMTRRLIVADTDYGSLYYWSDQTGIQALEAQLKTQLWILSATAVIFGLLLCWWLSSHVLNRLNKLGQALEAVVDDQGRVKGSIEPAAENDAIGHLSKRFVVITERLRQYNEYLELLSRRLAHELRTPVSVVRSSLENLEASADADQQKFVQRANNGVSRLTNILNSMSEASRLEQSLDKDEVVVFDLSGVIRGCFEGYEQAFPQQPFELIVESDEQRITGIPEMIAQMLDKLVDNAEQFSEVEQPIILRISSEQDNAVLRVSNSGPSLPDKMSNQLFDPMISVRDATASEDSHLGLGLYVARLIAQFHGGRIELRNREDRQGVVVTVTIPLLRLTSKLA